MCRTNRDASPCTPYPPRLVHRFTRRDVRGDLGFVQGLELHGRSLDVGSRRLAFSLHDDSRQHVVAPAGEQTQHPGGVGLVGRLAEDLFVNDHDRVCGDDRPPTRARQDRRGLVSGDTEHVRRRDLAWTGGLVHVGWQHIE